MKRFFYVMFTALLLIGAVSAAQDGDTDTFISADGTISFDYPQGWFATEFEGVILVVSDMTVMDAGLEEMGPGQVAILIATPDEADTLAGVAAETPEELLTTLVEQEQTMQFGELEDVNLNGLRGLEVSYISDDGYEGFIYAIDVGGDVMLAMYVTPQGERLTQQEVVLDILNTLSVSTASVSTPAPTWTPIPPSTPFPTITPVPASGGSDFGAEIVWQVQMPIDGSAAAGTELEDVRGIGISATDKLYIANGDFGIVVMNYDGGVVGVLDVSHANPLENEVGSVADVALSDGNRLWIADALAGRLHQLDTDGNLLQSSASTGFSEESPATLAIGSDGKIYTYDSDPSGAIYRFRIFEPDLLNALTAHLQLQRQIGEAPADLLPPALKIALGPDANIYIGTRRGSVLVLTPRGDFVREILLDETQINRVVLVGPDGSIYAGNPSTGAILKFDANGKLVARIGVQAAANGEFTTGQFFEISDLALLFNGDLVVLDHNDDYAQVVRITFR